MDSKTKEARLAHALKRRLRVWLISNEDVLNATKGTFLRSRVELELAAEDLARSLGGAFQKFRIRLGKLFRKR